MLSLYYLAFVHSPPRFTCYIYQTSKVVIQGIYKFICTKTRNQIPTGLIFGQEQIYICIQAHGGSSLVLGGPDRVLKVPIACEVFILAL